MAHGIRFGSREGFLELQGQEGRWELLTRITSDPTTPVCVLTDFGNESKRACFSEIEENPILQIFFHEVCNILCCFDAFDPALPETEPLEDQPDVTGR